MGLYTIKKIKIKSFLGDSIISPCKKYKRTSIEIEGDDIIKIITKPETVLKSELEINIYQIIYSFIGDSDDLIRQASISLDDFDKWICSEYGQTISDYLFDTSDKFNNKRIYIVNCIHGDNKKIAPCLTKSDAIALFYSECIDRRISYKLTHNGSAFNYSNGCEGRFVRIWIDCLELNKWEEQ